MSDADFDDPDDAEIEAIDASLDAMAVEEESRAITATVAKSKAPLMDIEAARAIIGNPILDTLDAKFKGSLTEMRYPDENDRLF